jgi:hypothetical protein
MAINIEQTINKAANNTGRRGLGVDFNHMATTRKVYDPYFFLDTELDLNVNPINFSDHKANGRIRHCKVDPHGYYDYIANKTQNHLYPMNLSRFFSFPSHLRLKCL